MTSYVTFLQLNPTCRVESIENLFKIPPNCNFSERQISVIPLCDLTRDFFCSRWAFTPINLVVSTKLAVYNSKSSKPNKSASPFRKKNLATFKSFHPASLMAWSAARYSPCQNPLFDSEDQLTGGTPTKGSDRCTLALAVTCVFTFAVASVVALFAASGSADSSIIRYSGDDLQRILRTVLDFKLPASVPAPVVTAAPHYKGPRERPLKAWFPDIYWGKTHLKCYNFFQQCKDHFATAGTIGPNRVQFAAIFLKDSVLFHWQQHQHKIEDQTNVLISWEGFKAFFCQSLGKSKAFIDTIWRKNFQH